VLELLLSIFVAVPCGGFYVEDPYDAFPLDARHVCVESRGGDVVFTIET
jgi:hypothetical protein